MNYAGLLLYMQTSYNAQAYEIMTWDSTRQYLTSTYPVWVGDQKPVIRPDGILGAKVLSTHATEETVTVGGFKCWIGGVEYTVSATTALAVRPVGNNAKIDSIQYNGSAVVVVEGTEAADAIFVDDGTRGGAGEPPYIAVGSIEIGQVWMNTSATAVIAADRIKQGGQYTEYALNPSWSQSNVGHGLYASPAEAINAHVKMSAVNPATHTGDVARGVSIQVGIPVYSQIDASDFKGLFPQASTAFKRIYNNRVLGSGSTNLSGNGSFIAYPERLPIADVVQRSELNTTFKIVFDPNIPTDYGLFQGIVGIDPDFSPTDNASVAVSIAATEKMAFFIA